VTNFTPTPQPEMTPSALDRYLDLFEELEIIVWLGGGWGVDALLGVPTRPHSDLDIVLEGHASAKLRARLSELGFELVETSDQSPWNFVMGNGHGHLIDFHVVEFDHEYVAIYGPRENGKSFPASSFTGRGVINGRPVYCLSAEFQIQSHSGYEIDEDDVRDMLALRTRFGLPLPAEYLPYEHENTL